MDNRPNVTDKKIHKSELMEIWRGAIVNMARQSEQSVLSEEVQPLPYDYQGSRFGHDGIRIEGNINFIAAILGCLGDLYALENEMIRLETVLHELHLSSVKPPYNKGQSHWVCYIRPIERNPEYTTIKYERRTP